MPTQCWTSGFHCIHQSGSLEVISKDYKVSTPLLQSPLPCRQPYFTFVLSLSSQDGIAHRPALNFSRSSSALKAELSSAMCLADTAPQHSPGLNSWPQGWGCLASTSAPAKGVLTQPDPCPRSRGRWKVKTMGKSKSHHSSVTDANYSLSVNFREAKISPDCSGFLQARQPGTLKGKPNPISFQKKPQIYSIAFTEMILNTCAVIFFQLPF